MIGSHRDNARFDRSRWRKRILLPCWIVQVGLLCGLMGIFSYRLSRTIYTWKEEENRGQIPLVEFVWEGVNILFSFISLIITLISIARFIAEALTPLPLVFSCILGLALSGAILALDIVVYVQHADRHYSMIGLGIDCGLMLFTIIPAIYAIIIYRRLLAYDDYHLPGNVKPYGFSGTDADTSYMSMAGYLQPPTPYDPTNTNNIGPSATTKAPENTRPRSLSAGRRLSLHLSRGPSPSPQPSPSPDPIRERRGSYDHRRDTQFDEYVARRASGGALNQEDVKLALGGEFWGGAAREERPRDSVVSSGMVSVAQARPRGNSLGRQASLEASLANRSVSPSIYSDDAISTVTVSTLATAAATVQRGHSLNSVPEAHEEEDELEKRRGIPAAQQGLLSRSSSGNGRTLSTTTSRSSISRYSIVGQIEGLEDIELESRKHMRES
ncbi:hypothetical protein F5X99DRAFT_68588 [Biscogniauxia marginata]|nr:hypothetical protein F5X99DRAFT_68588 [Biscogniauxia marginata]